MSAQVTIIANCACSENLEVENDFTDDNVVLKIYPCKSCVQKALEGLVYNHLVDVFQSPLYVTPEVLKVYEAQYAKNVR